MSSKFSIIIPVYNVAPYLRECLDSVLAQTFTDWEAICVDDGSTDGSGGMLDEYALKDPRFKVIHQPNAGVSAARNAALDVAQGEWICFVDADDMVLPMWLEDIDNATLQHADADWIRIRYRDWNGGADSKPWSEDSVLYEPIGTWIGEEARHHCFERLSRVGTPWGNVLRRGFIGDHRYLNGLALREDVLFLNFLLNRLNKLVAAVGDNYRYRLRNGSASHSVLHCVHIIKLLDGFCTVWQSRYVQPELVVYVLRKVLYQWLDNPDSTSWKNGMELAKILRRMHARGWLRFGDFECRSERFCWWLFAYTGSLLWLKLFRSGLLSLPRRAMRKLIRGIC